MKTIKRIKGINIVVNAGSGDTFQSYFWNGRRLIEEKKQSVFAASDEEEREFANQFPNEHAYVKHHNTGYIAPDAYDKFWEQGRPWQKPEKYPKLLKRVTLKDGTEVDFRQEGTKNEYVKPDADGWALRDEQGNAIYMSDEEIERAGLPVYATTIMAFNDKGECVGQASDEFGADGVWVHPDYQKKGLGTLLLTDFRRQFKKVRQMGQMTPQGQQLVRNYYRSLTGKEPTPMKDEFDDDKNFRAQQALWRFFANTDPNKVPDKFKPAYEELLHLSDNVKAEEAQELLQRVREWVGLFSQKDWISPSGLRALKTAANEYVYHGTTMGRAHAIARTGLKSGKDAGNTLSEHVYFSDEKYARTYADRKGGSTGVVLRVKRTPDMVPDEDMVYPGDFKIKRTIPPEEIEISTPEGWRPLMAYVKAAALREAKVNPATLKQVAGILKELRDEEGPGQCYTMAEILNDKFGWEERAGFYIKKQTKSAHAGHGDHACF